MPYLLNLIQNSKNLYLCIGLYNDLHKHKYHMQNLLFIQSDTQTHNTVMQVLHCLIVILLSYTNKISLLV